MKLIKTMTVLGVLVEEPIDLRPCPFCGEVDPLRMLGYGGRYFIQCGCCQTSGPDGNDNESALVQWQNRVEGEE